MNTKQKNKYFTQALALYKLKKYDEAFKCFDEAIKLDPADSYLYKNKGSAFYLLNRNEEAIECFDKVIAINPNDAEAHNLKSIVLSTGLCNYKEAIKYCNKAIAIDPNYADAYDNKEYNLEQIQKKQQKNREV